MPKVESKHYGFRKGRYAVDKLPHSSKKHKYFNVVNTETDEVMNVHPYGGKNAWNEACFYATFLDKQDPVPESTFVPIADPSLRDAPLKVRTMGEGDPF